MTSTLHTPVVAYMRYSSDNQNPDSIEYQRTNIQDYCNKNNYDIVQEYVDEALTGRTSKRKGFQQMISDSKKKPVWKKVIVFAYNRFARSIELSIKYKDILKSNNILVESVTESFDDTPEGHLLEVVTSYVDEKYSYDNSKHTHASMKEYAFDCLHCGGIPPLGYNVDMAHKKLVINPYEAEIVKSIFNYVEMGYSYNNIAKKLNEQGYTSKAGKPFTKNSFESILSQKKYIGTYTWNKVCAKNREGEGNSHAHKPIEEQVIIPNGCPAIISPEQFYKVQELLHSRKDGTATSKRRNFYMLSGLKILQCSECGSLMIGKIQHSHGKRYATYYCPKHKIGECGTKEIRAENLDHFVALLLAKDLYKRTDHKKISEEMKLNAKSKSIKNRLDGNKKATQNIVNALAKYQDDALLEKLKFLAAEREVLEKNLASLRSAATEINNNNKKSFCKKFAKYIETSDDAEAREYLKETITSILVSNDDVKISLTDF